jgi:hypothetical protein
MRTSDPAGAALRIAELTLVLDAPVAVDGELGTSPEVYNVPPGAVYARVPDAQDRWLALVSDDGPTGGQQAPPGSGRSPAPQEGEAELPPMAEPLATAVAGVFDSPASVVGLLKAANEHRRVVDEIWAAFQAGALQLPAALAERIERTRTTWPAALMTPVSLPS